MSKKSNPFIVIDLLHSSRYTTSNAYTEVSYTQASSYCMNLHRSNTLCFSVCVPLQLLSFTCPSVSTVSGNFEVAFKYSE